MMQLPIRALQRPLIIVQRFISTGHPQSVLAKKNITASIVIKGIGILINLALVPLVLNYLGSVKFGIWVTLGSIILWINFFDIGLGNGLRNMFAQAKARNDTALAKSYVSTTYLVLISVCVVLFFVFIFVSPHINWLKVFNAPPGLRASLESLVRIVYIFFLLQFILKILGTVLMADQRPAISNSFNVLSNLLILAGALMLPKSSGRGSLVPIGLLFSIMPPLVLLIASFYYYSTRYRPYRPALASVNLKYFRSLISLGGQYFIIHFAWVVLFSTNAMIITQVLGPEQVTPYNIAFKYFNVAVMANSIIIQPFWSAFTHAFTVGDFPWIRKMMTKLRLMNMVLIAGVVIMLAFSGLFYRLWVGGQVVIPFRLSVAMSIYVIIVLIGSPYNAFIMGVGKIRITSLIQLIAIPINIPLSIWLAKLAHLGSSGVMLATCLCILPWVTLFPIQYHKIINNRARGLWNK